MNNMTHNNWSAVAPATKYQGYTGFIAYSMPPTRDEIMTGITNR